MRPSKLLLLNVFQANFSQKRDILDGVV
jgi:hypothetical protein